MNWPEGEMWKRKSRLWVRKWIRYSGHPNREFLRRGICYAESKLQIGRHWKDAARRGPWPGIWKMQNGNENRLEVQCEAPLAWICPNVLSPDVRVDRFRFRSDEFRQNMNLQLTQAGRVLYQKRFSRLNANDSLNLSGEWVEKVDFAGEPVKLVVQP